MENVFLFRGSFPGNLKHLGGTYALHQKEEKRRQGKGTEKQTKRELRTTGGILIELLNKNKTQFPVRQALHTTFTSLVGNSQVSCITSTNNTECQKSNYISFCLNSKTRRCRNIFSEVGWALKITNLKLQESWEKATACINPPPQTPHRRSSKGGPYFPSRADSTLPLLMSQASFQETSKSNVGQDLIRDNYIPVQLLLCQAHHCRSIHCTSPSTPKALVNRGAFITAEFFTPWCHLALRF